MSDILLIENIKFFKIIAFILIIQSFLFQLLSLSLFILLIRNLLFFFRSQRFEYFANVWLFFNLIIDLFFLDYLLRSANLILEISFNIKPKITIRHNINGYRVFTLFLLTIGHLECLCCLVKSEKFIHKDNWWRWITHNYVPSFNLEERIRWSTAKISFSVWFYSDNHLEEVASSNVIFIVDFELMLNFQFGIIFNAFFDVSCPIRVQKTQQIISFLLFCHKSVEVSYPFLFLLFHYLICLLAR
jgi:hypothetical protein